VSSVLITVDTELTWGHHAAGLDLTAQIERSLEPAGVGIGYQLEILRQYDLKATFFVDPMPAMIYGLDAIRPTVAAIRAAGQDVQLHLHPNWTAARPGDGGARHARFEMHEYSLDEQRGLIVGATDLLKACGAPHPVAFRAGSYSANDDTLIALAELGFRYDSSHNGADVDGSRISLPARQIAPVARHGLTEVPVTLIEDVPGNLRQFQICALSQGEMLAALDHAVAEQHATTVIVSHGFELASRTGMRANSVHVGRFNALCALLAERQAELPTSCFHDLRDLEDGEAEPLPPNVMRTRWRQAEQLWSNLIEERAA
jgi:peptidoglycan/xylan/chitin deacetylase (PgdA/CDA1 family)